MILLNSSAKKESQRFQSATQRKSALQQQLNARAHLLWKWRMRLRQCRMWTSPRIWRSRRTAPTTVWFWPAVRVWCTPATWYRSLGRSLETRTCRKREHRTSSNQIHGALVILLYYKLLNIQIFKRTLILLCWIMCHHVSLQRCANGAGPESMSWTTS